MALTETHITLLPLSNLNTRVLFPPQGRGRVGWCWFPVTTGAKTLPNTRITPLACIWRRAAQIAAHPSSPGPRVPWDTNSAPFREQKKLEGRLCISRMGGGAPRSVALSTRHTSPYQQLPQQWTRFQLSWAGYQRELEGLTRSC